ncbi:MAG TPA: hypothetical protein ENJ18_04060 [Nannocystis exedens]|nr:hypothetical protein [Nannocystis exedens]
MSHSRPSTDPLIRRLQPYIDGELDSETAASVAAEIAEDPALKDMVEEQLRSRQLLQSLEKETAPQALRARVLLELDAVDRETEFDKEAARKRGWGRLRNFFRGALVLTPAAAAALFLFAITRVGTPASTDSPIAPPAVQQDMSLSTLQPQIIDRPMSGAAEGVNLVSLGKLDSSGDPQPELFEYRLNRYGARAFELRQASRGGTLRGTRRSYRGRTYFVSTDRIGRPVVAYDDGRQLHILVSTDPTDGGDLQALLKLGAMLRQRSSR